MPKSVALALRSPNTRQLEARLMWSEGRTHVAYVIDEALRPELEQLISYQIRDVTSADPLFLYELRDHLRRKHSGGWLAQLSLQFEGHEIVQLLQTDPTIVISEELGIDSNSGRWRREVVIQHPDGRLYELISEGGYNEPDPYNGPLTGQDALLNAREVVPLEVIEGDEPSHPARIAA